MEKRWGGPLGHLVFLFKQIEGEVFEVGCGVGGVVFCKLGLRVGASGDGQ